MRHGLAICSRDEFTALVDRDVELQGSLVPQDHFRNEDDLGPLSTHHYPEDYHRDRARLSVVVGPGQFAGHVSAIPFYPDGSGVFGYFGVGFWCYLAEPETDDGD